MQVHLARLVLQPDCAADPTLEHFLEECRRAVCATVAAEHEQAKPSAREAAVIQSLRICLSSSGSSESVQVQVGIPHRHAPN